MGNTRIDCGICTGRHKKYIWYGIMEGKGKFRISGVVKEADVCYDGSLAAVLQPDLGDGRKKHTDGSDSEFFMHLWNIGIDRWEAKDSTRWNIDLLFCRTDAIRSLVYNT